MVYSLKYYKQQDGRICREIEFLQASSSLLKQVLGSRLHNILGMGDLSPEGQMRPSKALATWALRLSPQDTLALQVASFTNSAFVTTSFGVFRLSRMSPRTLAFQSRGGGTSLP